ncbi:hypothetical protein [Leifsonia sp. C5G2]|uniref:hypothetical protein n=1 Tax=Leifsonia sp. C5G2 TaxID=2735269 RepID=UPI0015853474|nr:hypothetical protein [Leifsonia sp. C5G2]NUU06293.1 hypothetical protein [Leifsonia sp. C5G2]
MTYDFVVMSSDRRITRRDGQGRKVLHADSDLKTFRVGRDYLVGYCGVARFKDQPMEHWVVELLEKVTERSMVKALCVAVESTVWDQGLYREPIAFMGVGFRDDAFGQKRIPHRWIWSNALDERGDFSPRHLSVDFRLSQSTVQPTGLEIATIGVDTTDAEVEAAMAEIGRNLPMTPEVVASAISSLSDTVAARDAGVGPSSLVTTLTRSGQVDSSGGYDASGMAHLPSYVGNDFVMRDVTVWPGATGFIGPYRDQLSPR